MSKTIQDERILRGMEAQLRLRRARLENGDAPLGWKAGFGSPGAMERLGIEAPLVGFLTAGTQINSGDAISVGGWKKPAVEPELAIHMARDLGVGATRERTRGAIGAVGMAIEVADVTFPPEEVEEILFGNIYNRHVMIGPSDASRAGGRLEGLSGQITRNGVKTAGTNEIQALTGDVVEIVRHAADLLGAFGLSLSAGEVIITGSIVPPLWVEEDEDILYHLEPIGTLAVRMVRS